MGDGVFHPKSLMLSPRNWYSLPIKTKDGGHGGSVVGEGDMVVWVLGCQDEKIRQGPGILTPKGRYQACALGTDRGT